MLNYSINKQPGKPLYEGLYEAIRFDILNGKLKAGQQLPSKREMAAGNGISITTVLNAYQQLLKEGYLISVEKRGYYVADLEAVPITHDPSPFQKQPCQETTWGVDFRSNNIMYRAFPLGTWKKVLREILSEYDTELVTRSDFYGIPLLRTQIAEYLYRTRGISVSPDCIVIGAGIEYLYARLITIFAPATIYAVENPGYQKISGLYQSYHLRWRSVTMDKSGIYIPDLRAKDIDIVHVSPEHHYPLGTMMPISRRQELLTWASEEEERYIIEDDFDCEFRYDSRPFPALKSLDVHGRVIYMNTFSKTLSPAVRVAYMVLPEPLMERYSQKTDFYTNTASSLEQYAVARFIEKGYFERHLRRIRKLYRQQGELLQRLISENKDIPVKKISNSYCGTHLLIELNTSLPDEEIKRCAAMQNVYVSFLSDYCTQNRWKYEHTMIINYSDLDEDILREAIRRLGLVFNR